MIRSLQAMRHLLPAIASAAALLTCTVAVAQNGVCTRETARFIASNTPDFLNLCSTKVKGHSHGCDYSVRAPSQLGPGESTDPDLGWVVKAMLIVGFDGLGRQRDTQDGSVTASVSNSCKIIGVGPSPHPPSHH